MTYFYSATGKTPVADHATLTEIRSVNDISNAVLFSAADRRPQTADRRPLVSTFLSRLFIGVTAMIALATLPMSAQGWDFLDIGYPLGNPLQYRRELFNGLVGIGPFTANPGFEPQRMLHVHSYRQGIASDGPYFPGFLRLQTQNKFVDGDNKYLFGETGIEFVSGSPLNTGAEWFVGKIGAVTNGDGYNASGAFKYVSSTDIINWKGGLAFYCSPSSQANIPGAASLEEVMRVIENRVGIKTQQPLYPLHVMNQIAIGKGNGISGPQNGDPAYLSEHSGILTLFPGNIGSWYHLHNLGGQLLFSAGGTPTESPSIMAMVHWGSRVRIGCSFLNAELPKIEGKFTISEDPATNSTYRSPVMLRVERRNDATYAASTPYKLISAGDNDKETFVVHSNGKVNIGKTFSGLGTSPAQHTDYLLSVSGKIVCNDLRVLPLTNNWPDYVFSANHKLMTLEEVEQSIKANQHLPGMPSAKEVEANGIDVGEMQRKLLEKMEEMTLYMIELKKENAELKAKIDAINLPTSNK